MSRAGVSASGAGDWILLAAADGDQLRTVPLGLGRADAGNSVEGAEGLWSIDSDGAQDGIGQYEDGWGSAGTRGLGSPVAQVTENLFCRGG